MTIYNALFDGQIASQLVYDIDTICSSILEWFTFPVK